MQLHGGDFFLNTSKSSYFSFALIDSGWVVDKPP